MSHIPCPRDGTPLCDGMWHLEDAVRALRGVHTLLGTAAVPLTPQDIADVWCAMQPLIRDLEHPFERLREEHLALIQDRNFWRQLAGFTEETPA
jgi:hypothetical protein